MKRRIPLVLSLGVGGTLLILGLRFPRFFFANVLMPMATALYLLLRFSLLAIDQKTYWWGLIFLAGLVAAGFLLRRAYAGLEAPEESDAGAAGLKATDPLAAKRRSILLDAESRPEADSLRKDLASLLASLYAEPYHGFAAYLARDALKAKRIELPEGVHDFLFAFTGPEAEAPPFLSNPPGWARAAARKLSRACRELRPRKAKTEEYLRAVDDALSFIERKMESKDEHLAER